MELFLRIGRGLRLRRREKFSIATLAICPGPFEAAVSELDLLRGLKVGTVRIAAVESLGLTFLPGLIAEFGALFPRLHVDVNIASAAGVIKQVVNDRADIGFGFIAKPDPDLAIAVRRDLAIGVVMHPGHPLATVEHLDLEATLTHPCALAKPNISIREVIDPYLSRLSDTMPPFVEVNSIRLLVELA